jgi:hypothetical protein
MKATQLNLLPPLQPRLRPRTGHIPTPRIDRFALLFPPYGRVEAEVLAGGETESEEGTVVDVVDFFAVADGGEKGGGKGRKMITLSVNDRSIHLRRSLYTGVVVRRLRKKEEQWRQRTGKPSTSSTLPTLSQSRVPFGSRR